MNKTISLLASTVVAAIGMAAVAQAESPTPAQKPSFANEKCYGIAKAGKNDCQTSNSSCAGTSKRDAQSDAWVYVPAGLCAKLVGSSKSPKA